MPGFVVETSQSGSDVFNMENFANYDFDEGQFQDQSFQPTYTNAFEDSRSIRPSDLDATAFNHQPPFEVSHPIGSTLKIDPSLTQGKEVLAQQVLARPLTPPTSRSPEQLDAVSSRPGSLTDAAAQGKQHKNKRVAGAAKRASTDEEDADVERKLKNRVAASKCRIKKKGREQQLIQEKDQKEHDNRKLKEEYRHMTQEALWYKNQLIMHGNCGDARINQWLSNSAARIVHQYGDAPTRRLDAPLSSGAPRPSAELQPLYMRRDSGISTSSKRTSHGSSTSVLRANSIGIGLGTPVEQVSPQNAYSPLMQWQSDHGVDPTGGETIKRVKSLDHSTLQTLAKVAASRAQSVPVQEADILDRTDPSHSDTARQTPPEKQETPSVGPAIVSSLAIDPRLRGGALSLDSPAEFLNLSMQQDEQGSDILVQNLGAKWMED